MAPAPASSLPLEQRCLVVGVLNVTPDSFSDGGTFVEVDAAVGHAHAMVAEGADLLDVGGESTRPGALRPDTATEIARVVPVLRRLRDGDRPVRRPISIDTMRAEVAAAALDAGADLVNDVSGGLADPAMLPLVAERGVPVVLMHWRGASRDMQRHTAYTDVVREVRDHLAARVDAAVAAGVGPERIVVDPGLGFAKRPEHNWALLHRLDAITDLGLPVLVAASRKSFLGALLADADGPRPTVGREDATTAVTALAAAAGAWAVRVHEVRPAADAVRVAARWGLG
jgi:dihydropteroate synthase